MAIRQKITVTRTRTRTRTRAYKNSKRLAANSGGRRRCPTCGKFM